MGVIRPSVYIPAGDVPHYWRRRTTLLLLQSPCTTSHPLVDAYEIK